MEYLDVHIENREREAERETSVERFENLIARLMLIMVRGDWKA